MHLESSQCQTRHDQAAETPTHIRPSLAKTEPRSPLHANPAVARDSRTQLPSLPAAKDPRAFSRSHCWRRRLQLTTKRKTQRRFASSRSIQPLGTRTSRPHRPPFFCTPGLKLFPPIPSRPPCAPARAGKYRTRCANKQRTVHQVSNEDVFPTASTCRVHRLFDRLHPANAARPSAP